MSDAQTRIADRARGVASERRLSQEQVAVILGISRQAVNLRFNGKVAFTAPEILTLAEAMNVAVTRFFPEPTAERAA